MLFILCSKLIVTVSQGVINIGLILPATRRVNSSVYTTACHNVSHEAPLDLGGEDFSLPVGNIMLISGVKICPGQR